MNRGLKKGIKGQLVAPILDNTLKYIDENIEVFKAVCKRDFEYCIFDIYEAEYEDNDVIGIDFNILDRTAKEADASYSRFKKELKNHFNFNLKEIFIGKYDKV